MRKKYSCHHKIYPRQLDTTQDHESYWPQQTRREFLNGSGAVLTSAFLTSLSHSAKAETLNFSRPDHAPLLPIPPQYPAKAKQIIYLHMAGGPSQLELFDYKPELKKYDGKPCPDSFLKDKRFAFISGVPNLLGSRYPFKQHGDSGAWMSDRLPFWHDTLMICVLLNQ